MANEFVAKNGLISQNNSVVTGSLIVTNGITGSLNGNADTATSASYSTVAANLIPGDKTIDGDLTVTGKVTAEEFHTEFVSSSIVYRSGSTKFGDSSDDTHSFTGSLQVQGSITGSLLGNASTSTSSSYALSASSVPYSGLTGEVPTWNQDTTGTAATASYVLNAISASYAANSTNATSASYALTSSFVNTLNQNVTITGSLSVTGSITATSFIKSGSTGAYLLDDGSTSSALNTRIETTYTASAGQTVFPLTYEVGQVEVFYNGAKLFPNEFTATNGTSIVLASSASLNAQISAVKYVSSLTSTAVRNETSFTATGGQNTFAATYTVGQVDVFYNGSKLETSEFTATNGTSVVLGFNCVAGDTVAILSYLSAVSGVSGSAGYIPKLTGTATMANSAIHQNGNNIGIGTTSASNKLTVQDSFSIRNSSGYDRITFLMSSLSPYMVMRRDSDAEITVSINSNDVSYFNGGNVGIGTITPITPLHVSGSGSQLVRINTSGALSSGYYDAFQLLAANQTGGGLSLNIGKAESTKNLGKIVYSHSSDGSNSNRLSLGFYDADNLFNLTAGGNVGIGTTSPARPLTIRSTHANATATTYTGALLIHDEPSGVSPHLGMGVAYNSGYHHSWIQSNNTDGTYPLALQPAGGNIGIGTTNPTTKLTIDNSSNSNTNHIDLVGYSSTSKGHLGYFGNATYLTSNYYYAGGQNNDTSSLGQASVVLGSGTTDTSYVDFALSSAGANSPSSKARLLANGNFGIGTTNPNEKLTVQSTTSSDNVVFAVRTNYSGNAVIAEFSQVAQDGILRMRSATSGTPLVQVSAVTGGSSPTYFNNGSPLYIGTTSNPVTDNATPQLGILAGANTDAVNIKHTANGNNSLNIWQTGTSIHSAIAFYKGDTQTARGLIRVDTGGTSYTSVSDYRLKENVTPIENGLNRLLQLKPSKFNWIETGNEAEGFIAHELQEIFPNAVTGEKDGEYSNGNINPQTVDYGRITPLLVAAIQEQQALIQSLTDRLSALENK